MALALITLSSSRSTCEMQFHFFVCVTGSLEIDEAGSCVGGEFAVHFPVYVCMCVFVSAWLSVYENL